MTFISVITIAYKMTNINVQKLFRFLVLITLFHKIRSNLNTVTEQTENSSRQQYKNHFSETADETDTSTFIEDGAKFHENELDKLFIRNFKTHKELEENKINVHQIMRPRRASKGEANATTYFGIDCFSCFSNTSSKNKDNCYDSVSMRSKKCADAEHCYTELNPLFIKRGCVLPGRVNRTFICRCPLCNDKPAFDTSHYEYKKVSDWEYDNARLQMPLVGMDLMCKVCETKGTNPTSDKNCRYGKNADYMVCAHNQLCYTNVDDESDFVSRGCMDRPLYNSIYYFCNNSLCNNDKFINPKVKLKFRAEQIMLKDEPLSDKKRKSKNKNKSKKRKSSHSIKSSVFMILSLMCLLFIKQMMFQI